MSTTIKEGGKMTTDVFAMTSSEFEPEKISDREIITEDAAHEEEPSADELELEKPSPEPLETMILKLGENPVHLYLHQIGRVPLLKASDEKIIARRIEIGRRISEMSENYKIKASVLSPAKFISKSFASWGSHGKSYINYRKI